MPSRTLLIHSAFAAVFVVMAVFAIATASGRPPRGSPGRLVAGVRGLAHRGRRRCDRPRTTAVNQLGRLEDARPRHRAPHRGMPEADLLPPAKRPCDGRGDKMMRERRRCR